MSLLFLQKRPVRAGAQTSLARLVESAPIRSMEPVALIGSDGWLAAQLQRQNVPVLVTNFPNPRSLLTRLTGLTSFAKKTASLLQARGIKVTAIVANDHQECPLALALSRTLGGVPVLAILRSSAMSRADFDKQHCAQCHSLMAVGQAFRDRVAAWTTKPVAVFNEGFTEAEFMPLKPWPPACPQRILVMGSEAPGKGFTDFIEAIYQLESAHPDFPGFQCDFTGALPSALDAMPQKPLRSTFQFLGRVEGFANLVRGYDLAVHPSRHETFGMAAVEAMLAGTPTLASLTGIIGQLHLPSAWTFPPHDLPALTERLTKLWRHWPDQRLDLASVQAQVRAAFHIDHTAAAIQHELQRLIA